jgi:hypothetical protein
MRRWKLFVTVLGLATVFPVAAIVVWPWPERIAERNFTRIAEGMRRAEVEAILGPPGDYTTGPTVGPMRGGLDLLTRDESYYPMYDATLEWKGNTAIIRVGFDSAGVATYKEYATNSRVDQGLFDNLLWRAKRQWHRWFP